MNLHLTFSGHGLGVDLDFDDADYRAGSPNGRDWLDERTATARAILDIARILDPDVAPTTNAAPIDLDLDRRRIADAVLEASRSAGPLRIRTATRAAPTVDLAMVDRIGERVEALEERIEGLDRHLDDLKARITTWSDRTAVLTEETAATLTTLAQRLDALEVTADHNPPELAARLDALANLVTVGFQQNDAAITTMSNRLATTAKTADHARGIAEGLQRRQVATANAIRSEVYRLDSIEGRVATLEGTPPAKPIPGAVPITHPLLSDLVTAARHVVEAASGDWHPDIENCSLCALAFSEGMLVAHYDHGIAEPAGYSAGPRAVELAELHHDDEEPNIGQHTAASYDDPGEGLDPLEAAAYLRRTVTDGTPDICPIVFAPDYVASTPPGRRICQGCGWPMQDHRSPISEEARDAIIREADAPTFAVGEHVAHISGLRGIVHALGDHDIIDVLSSTTGYLYHYPARELISDDTDDLDQAPTAADVEAMAAELETLAEEVEEPEAPQEEAVDDTPPEEARVAKAGINPDEVYAIVEELRATGQAVTGRAVADRFHQPTLAGPIARMLDARGWR